MRNKILIVLVLLLALGFGAIRATSALSVPAVTSIKPSCTELKISLMYYNQPRAVRLNNQVTVNVDGFVTTEKFGANYFRTFQWDPTQEHFFTVTIDGNQIMGNTTVNDSVTSDYQPVCS